MMRTKFGVISVAAVALLGGACKKDKPASTGGTGGTAATGGGEAQPAAPATLPIGVADPFARVSGDGAKSLDKAWKAARAKKWDDAAAGFREVTAAAPDYLPARWALVRALVLGGKLAEVPKEFEELLARDFVGYVTKLDKPKELAPLRAAPEWQKIEELKGRYRAAWVKGLVDDKSGVFFVARTRPAGEIKPDAPLDLHQEIFFWSEGEKRFRKITDTDGHAFALDLTPGRKQLTFLVVGKVAKDQFVEPKVGAIDLATLETVGPFAMKDNWEEVTLTHTAEGAPVFGFRVGERDELRAIDTARTGLAEGAGLQPAGGETHARLGHVWHVDAKTPEKVKVQDGASSFTIEGVAQPVVAARPLAATSLDWSPGKQRITYAGKLDACKAIEKGKDAEKNELYVYDVAKKSAQRIAAGVSEFETLWLDDDRLLYESGIGKGGQLHVYTFSTHADATLPTKHGAGLYGVPSLSCEKVEVVDEDLPNGEEVGD